MVAELGLVHPARGDGQQIAVLQDADAGLYGAGADVEGLGDGAPAGQLEQKPVTNCVDESLPLQQHPGVQVVHVDGYGAVVVDDERRSLLGYVLQADHIVAVVDPGMGVPDGGHYFPSNPPEVAIRLHGSHDHLSGKMQRVKGVI